VWFWASHWPFDAASAADCLLAGICPRLLSRDAHEDLSQKLGCRGRVAACIDYLGLVTQQPRKVRRKPKFTAFLVTGALMGLLIGFFLSVSGPGDPSYDGSAVLGFLGLIGAGLGMLVGGIIAVLLDKRP
jgi:hypothetical protein